MSSSTGGHKVTGDEEAGSGVAVSVLSHVWGVRGGHVLLPGWSVYEW